MAMKLRVVSPEECVFEGMVAYVAVPSTAGEFGILPHHASEICTIESGRIRVSEQQMGVTDRVFAVEDGYVQVANDEVIVLATRAIDTFKVDVEEVAARLTDLESQMGKMSENDGRRAYLYNEIAWCKLLLAQ